MFGQFPGSYAGMDVMIVDAQKQGRTACDVRGPWVRTKVPSKKSGRKGTRRRFKQTHPPGFVMLYREPDDVLVIQGRTIIATPKQANYLRRAQSEDASRKRGE